MGSPITFSGFNDIDFNAVLNAVMTQESAPLTSLQTQQSNLASKTTTFATLAAKLTTFQSAVAALTDDSTLLGRTTSNTNESAMKATAGATAAPGTYDVIVQELARAQVTPSTSTTPDADTTVVAWGGALTIGGIAVTIDAPVTLKGLAERINATKDIGVTASVVKSGDAAWQLVLTGRGTGTISQFTVSNTMTGGSGVTFGDATTNAVQATDAKALINNVQVVSSTNTIEDAISGVSLTLLKKDPTSVVTLTVAEDLSTAKANLHKVVDAYNDLVKFSTTQNTASANGDASSIGRDPLLRGLRDSLRNALSSQYGSGGGLGSLANVGIEFQRTGLVTFSDSKFDAAAATNMGDVRTLFTGDGTNVGAFSAISDLVKQYTKADGLLKDTNTRLTAQASALSTRIADLTDRLALRRLALQQEYTNADLAMSQLKSSSSGLSALSSQYRLF